MKVKYILVLLLFPFIISAQTLKIKQPVRFLALGDSYTIGESVAENERWPNQLKDSLQKRKIAVETVKIIATTGWRTDNLLNAIAEENLAKENYNLVALLIGVNNQYQGRSINQYKTELAQLIDSAVHFAGSKSQVFIVSIPDYAFTPFGQQSGNATQISKEIDTYNAINKQMAKENNIKYFDITPISRQGLADPQLVAKDGLHPSGKQYSLWVNLMLQHIDSNLTTGLPFLKRTGEVKIYPNPTKNIITIDTKNKSRLYETDIKVYSLDGKLQQCEIAVENEQLQLNASTLKAGIYIINLKDKDGVSENYKVLIEK